MQVIENMRVQTGIVPGSNARVSVDLPLTIVSPHRGWFDWRLGQLWRYRDLIMLFVWRDFVAVYKQTVLGPAWHIVRPLLTTVIYTIVFGRVAGLSTDGAPPFLFYMAGNIAWSYFANCIDNISKTFAANTHLMGKVYFHRLTIPISLVLSNVIAFAIQLGIFLVVLIAYGVRGTSAHPTEWVLMLPAVLVMLAGYSFGGGIIVCAVTTRYRDLVYLVTFGIQLLMFLTPVIYPMSTVPEQYQWLMHWNPLSPLMETFRLAFLGVGTVTAGQLGISAIGMVGVVIVGLMLFSRVERTFMDTV